MVQRKLILPLFYIITIISAKSRENRISVENSLQGTDSWWYDQQSTPITIIHGFSDQISYYPGDIVSFKISHPLWMPYYQLEIYRLGYYHGQGGRLVANITSNRSSSCSSSSSSTTTTTTTTTIDDKLRVAHRYHENTSSNSYSQPPCNFDIPSRMTDCSNWNISISWMIPYNLITGIMIALPVYYSFNESNRLLLEKHYGNYIPFIIKYKPNHIGSDILFKTSDTTWVAYNKYGNWNLYRGNGSFHVNSRAYKASYNRPWQNRYLPPEGQYQNFLFGSEYPMLYWLEQHSYDVSYMACKDVEELLSSPSSSFLSSSDRTRKRKKQRRKKKYNVLLSVGHDEYWTTEMRSVYEEARNIGIHLAFFSGNEMFWRIIWDQQHNHDNNDDGNGSSISAIYDIGGGESGSIDGFISNNNNASILNNHDHRSSMSSSSSKSSSTYSSKRVFICRKETIDNKQQVTSPHDWTGTFRDPRHHRITAVPENALTGQLFMVNAHRNDSMHVTYDHAFLRFWRDTDIYIEDHYDQDDANLLNVGYNTTTRADDSTRSSDSGINVIYHPKHNTHIGYHDRQIRKEGPYNNYSSRITNESTGIMKDPIGIMKDPIGTNKDPKGIRKDPTDIKYTTPRGVLGYEWDVSIDNYHRPSGWFSLSSTTIYINKSLLMQYGAYYNGSGYATHQLSLYRYYKSSTVLQHISIDDIASTLRTANTTSTTTTGVDKDNEYSRICHKALHHSDSSSSSSGSKSYDSRDVSSNNDQRNHRDHHNDDRDDHHRDHDRDHHHDIHHDDRDDEYHDYHRNTTSSLVFGAGTVQWSWALSDRHDGYIMPVDSNLQQATMNLLADMDVYPATTTSTSTTSTTSSTSTTTTYAIDKAVDMGITCIRGVNRSCVTKDYISPKSTIRSARIRMQMIIGERREASIDHRMLLLKKKKHGIIVYDHDHHRQHYKNYHTHELNTSHNRYHLTKHYNVYYHTNQYHHGHNSSKQSQYHHQHHQYHHRYIRIYGTAIDYGGGVVSSVEVSVDLGRTWQLTTSHLVRMTTTIGMVRHWHILFQVVDDDDDNDYDDYDDGNNQNRSSNIHHNKDDGDDDDEDGGCCITDVSDSDSDRIRSDFIDNFREHVSISMSLLRMHCRCCADHAFNHHHHHNHRHHLKYHHIHRHRLKYHHHYDHHHQHHRLNQSSDHIVVLSRAVDDSGWIEPVDITSILCKLHTLRDVIIHNNYTTTTITSSSSPSSISTNSNRSRSSNDDHYDRDGRSYDALMKMKLITHNIAILSYR